MTVQWNMLAGAPDIGERFNQGFEAGRQRQAQSALGRAVQGDPRGMNVLAGLNPQAYMQLRQMGEQKQERGQAQQQQQQEQITRAAQTLGPIYQEMARLPYEQRRPYLQRIAPRLTARGIPESIIADYDPTDDNLQADIALSRERTQQQPTNIQREVEYYRSIGRPDMADQLLQRHAEGPPVVFDVTGDGAPDLVPRSYFNNAPAPSAAPAEVPVVNTPEEARNLPPGTEFQTPDGRRMRVPGAPQAQGGASPSGSQTFPAGLDWLTPIVRGLND